MAQSIAGYEASAEVTVVYLEVRRDARKQGAVHGGRSRRDTICSAARRQCNACHRDGGPGEDPLFYRLPLPAISELLPIRGFPTMAENRPDAFGYIANPQGSSFVDGGRRQFFSARDICSAQPSAVDARWLKLAPDNQARIQVPTLRNVGTSGPYPAFVKAYGHNWIFHEPEGDRALLQYARRAAALPSRMTLVKVRTCWAGAGIDRRNMNTSRVGRLGPVGRQRRMPW